MKYLDPKADLTFKKVFGEHKDLLQSFLNALLPLEPDEEVVELEYLPAEMVPDNPMKKNSIVDVRCKDNYGRQFIVEMQMIWTPGFEQRVLFNASKAYVRQLDKNERYDLLQSVYALSLLNDIFLPDMPDEFYHPYHIVHDEHTDKVINGLQLIFVELPKFTPHTMTEKKMTALWLRYLTEIDEKTRQAPDELLENPEVKKALEVIEESAYSDAQLLGYDKFWDAVRVENTLFYGGRDHWRAEGLAEGREEGREQGRAEGKKEESLSIARNLKQMGMTAEQIRQATGLSLEDIENCNCN